MTGRGLGAKHRRGKVETRRPSAVEAMRQASAMHSDDDIADEFGSAVVLLAGGQYPAQLRALHRSIAGLGIESFVRGVNAPQRGDWP
ncbi:MAG: hypothetical protein AAGC77_04335 [Pseudomonadota bacterium]